jgi:hypothetical protein
MLAPLVPADHSTSAVVTCLYLGIYLHFRQDQAKKVLTGFDVGKNWDISPLSTTQYH